MGQRFGHLQKEVRRCLVSTGSCAQHNLYQGKKKNVGQNTIMHSLDWQQLKICRLPSIGEGVEPPELSQAASDSVKWCSHFEKYIDSFF